MKNLRNKTVLVTGAARGMGKCLSELLLKQRCRVALVDIDRNLLKETESELSRKGKCRAFLCDITDEAAVETLATDIQKQFGPVNILVNNAGIVKAAPVSGLSETDVQKMIDVNLTALIRCCRIFLPQLIESGDAQIVNMASAGGILAIPDLSVYSATKFGVIGFTDSLRQEMKRSGHNVIVSYVTPNTVNTGMFEGSSMVKGTKMLSPERVAGAILNTIIKGPPLCAIPRFSLRVVTPLLKLILPINGMDSLNRRLGMWTINSDWQGRKSADN
ncbi:MAG: SDR family NAD(P)-dependent oxidoreductase [Spirochaetales bacterium]|nr:SDR family NAD(P)-dependent oxidoreductase [Spirochaetales bacterium]